MSSDFTILPKEVARIIGSCGCPLTDEQYELMSGAMAGMQLMIEQIGLEATIDVFDREEGK